MNLGKIGNLISPLEQNWKTLNGAYIISNQYIGTFSIINGQAFDLSLSEPGL